MTKKAYTLYRVRAASNSLFLTFSIFLFTVSSQAQSADKKPLAPQASVLQTLVEANFQSVTIEEVLKTITSKYKIAFTYVNNEIPLSKKVTLRLSKQSLSKVLDVLFANQSIVYQEIGTQVVLKKKEAVSLSNSDKTPSNAAKGELVTASNQRNDSTSRSPNSSSSSFSNKKEGRGKFSFSFLKRKKKPTYIPSFGPKPLDSTSLAKDSLEKKIRPVQKNPKKVTAVKKPWAIGVHLSPEITYRFLNGKEKSVAARNAVEKRGTGSAFGVTIERTIKGPFYFRTGISLLTFKEKATYSSLKPYLPPPPQRDLGFRTDTSISYSNTYRFLGIPLLLGFTGGEKWFFSANMGLMPTLFINSKTTYSGISGVQSYPDDYVPNPEIKPPPPPLKKKGPGGRAESDYFYDKELDLQHRTFHSLGLAYVLSVEGGYKIEERFRVSVSPVFKCFLTSIQSEKKDTKEKPYSMGLSFAAYYCF